MQTTTNATGRDILPTFYDLVTAPAAGIDDSARASEVIGAAVREFNRAFPEDAKAIANAVFADYATRDKMAPRVPYRLDAPAPRADDPIDVAF
jgi:hypothetical protein